MSLQEIIRETKDAFRKKNNKKLESIFSSSLRQTHCCDLWLLYLQYAQTKSKETLREAQTYAYTRTMLSIESTDIKIQYLEMLMQSEEKDAIKEAYMKSLEVPLLRVETLIEFHRSYEATKRGVKTSEDLVAKEAAAIAESNRLRNAVLPGAEAAAEYILKRHQDMHPLYPANVTLYALDAAIEQMPTSAPLAVYKALFLAKTGPLENAYFANPQTQAVVAAHGTSERNTRLGESLTVSLAKTNGSLSVLAALTSYQFDPDALLKQAPPSITAQSDSFYLVFFSALLRHRDIIGVRKYLVTLTREGKIGAPVFVFCAAAEGLVARERKNAGGILLAGLKRFLAQRDAENARRVAAEGARLLLALGDAQRARTLVEIQAKESLGGPEEDLRDSVEAVPRLVIAQHQVLYERGFLALVPLLSKMSYPAVYQFLGRCYGLQTETPQEEVPEALLRFTAELLPIRESHNICSNVNLDAVVQLLAHLPV
ncbi:hypothetical protein NEHOM01_0172 [Nematocida homosporus]|uniref:uncharacterized protein n=1 Tax=Nematocida homosporus TaxID=1912981 RepID=UPI00221FD265|nr:uncharacterized protein NEHOM01_0172 [Nematocida homosporus]KAI5184427.1 hypothetical protein NEHOM01_0172 [Nematocida homosporus]